jgi:ribonuclease J
MLHIEVYGKRILYSGDFRTHGRKSALPPRLMKNPPASLDVLLMEGTNLGSDKCCVTESDLEDEFVELFRSTAGRVFVAWSAQNVDRTGHALPRLLERRQDAGRRSFTLLK